MASVKRGTIAIECAWPFAYAALLFGVIGWLNFVTADDRQYSALAESFLKGKLFFLAESRSGWADTASFEGQHYSALGPFPAVLIMPLVWSGYFHQGQLSFVASLAVFYLCFRLARRCNYSYQESCWFALAFCFATSFIGVAALPSSNFFAHVLAVIFLFLAINEYQGKCRPWLIGGWTGLAMANRAPAGLNILFFTLSILFGFGTIREKATGVAKLLLVFGVVVGLLALYNFSRFGDPLESGYSYQVNGMGIPYADWNVPGNTPGPPIRLSNIPSHLRVFLFGLPSAKAIGTSVLLMSPFFSYLVMVRRWDLTNRLITLNIVLVLLMVLAFRSTGFEQVGYRFSLDFLPFVFFLLMRSHVELTDGFKGLIFTAIVVDLCLTLYFLASGVDRRTG